ncbi:hypothetical protein WJX72_003125 [[Myrmecia] bisecta]|uniref:RAMA domain-containing protein n=1 Tax=[Myrmecia] bisecta TaxID=41462 RepID=A0AAW1R5C6_9CHLO
MTATPLSVEQRITLSPPGGHIIRQDTVRKPDAHQQQEVARSPKCREPVHAYGLESQTRDCTGSPNHLPSTVPLSTTTVKRSRLRLPDRLALPKAKVMLQRAACVREGSFANLDILEEEQAELRERPVSMAMLVHAGLLRAGHHLLVIYKEHQYTAELCTDGSMVYKGERFEAPSALSGRITAHSTDGWLKVRYRDASYLPQPHLYLDHFRKRFLQLRRQRAVQRQGLSGHVASSQAPPSQPQQPCAVPDTTRHAPATKPAGQQSSQLKVVTTLPVVDSSGDDGRPKQGRLASQEDPPLLDLTGDDDAPPVEPARQTSRNIYNSSGSQRILDALATSRAQKLRRRNGTKTKAAMERNPLETLTHIRLMSGYGGMDKGQLRQVANATAAYLDGPREPHAQVRVRAVTDPEHPIVKAVAGALHESVDSVYGMFATAEGIRQPWQVVGEYVGEALTDEEHSSKAKAPGVQGILDDVYAYEFAADGWKEFGLRPKDLIIDSSCKRNAMAYINDQRSKDETGPYASRPQNVTFMEVLDCRRERPEPHCMVINTAPVCGEDAEFLTDYGQAFWDIVDRTCQVARELKAAKDGHRSIKSELLCEQRAHAETKRAHAEEREAHSRACQQLAGCRLGLERSRLCEAQLTAKLEQAQQHAAQREAQFQAELDQAQQHAVQLQTEVGQSKEAAVRREARLRAKRDQAQQREARVRAELDQTKKAAARREARLRAKRDQTRQGAALREAQLQAKLGQAEEEMALLQKRLAKAESACNSGQRVSLAVALRLQQIGAVKEVM